MSFKQPLFVPSSTEPIGRNKVSRQPRNSSKLDFCKVCGDTAYIVNYGALSCQSCKTFFRRNGLHPQNIRSCLFNNSCRVNMNTRRCCTACRLNKCFTMGMKSCLIRKEEKKMKAKSTSTKVDSSEHSIPEQVTSAQSLTISNRLDKILSINKSEWTLLSNIVHAHDTFTAIPHIRHIIARSSTLPVDMQIIDTSASEIFDLIYTSMQSFISSSPNFQILTTSEQFSLVIRNFSSITIFYFVLMFSDPSINNEYKCIDVFTSLYGPDILLQAKNINKQLVSDATIIKLMLIVLAFSSNCSIVHIHENLFNDGFLYGTYCLFGTQNIYMELLWKFMIYHYDYYNSVVRFSRLIGLFLSLIKYSTIVYENNDIYRKLVDDVFQKAKQSLVNNQGKSIHLWGKKPDDIVNL